MHTAGLAKRVLTAVLAAGLALATSCKPKGATSLQSLENFTAGNVRENDCSGKVSADDMARIDQAYRPRIFNAKEAYYQPIFKAISAVPPSLRSRLLALGFRVEFKPAEEMKALCGSEEAGSCARSFFGRTTSARTSVYINASQTDAEVVAQIRHSLVREVGFLMAEVASRLAVRPGEAKAAPSLSLAVDPAQAELSLRVANAYVADILSSSLFPVEMLKRNLSEKSYASVMAYAAYPEKDGKATNYLTNVTEAYAFSNEVFAEAFDSYYCNAWESHEKGRFASVMKSIWQDPGKVGQLFAGVKNTRALMAELFPKTYAAFDVYGRFHDKLSRNQMNAQKTSGLRLQDDGAEGTDQGLIALSVADGLTEERSAITSAAPSVDEASSDSTGAVDPSLRDLEKLVVASKGEAALFGNLGAESTEARNKYYQARLALQNAQTDLAEGKPVDADAYYQWATSTSTPDTFTQNADLFAPRVRALPGEFRTEGGLDDYVRFQQDLDERFYQSGAGSFVTGAASKARTAVDWIIPDTAPGGYMSELQTKVLDSTEGTVRTAGRVALDPIDGLQGIVIGAASQVDQSVAVQNQIDQNVRQGGGSDAEARLARLAAFPMLGGMADRAVAGFEGANADGRYTVLDGAGLGEVSGSKLAADLTGDAVDVVGMVSGGTLATKLAQRAGRGARIVKAVDAAIPSEIDAAVPNELIPIKAVAQDFAQVGKSVRDRFGGMLDVDEVKSLMEADAMKDTFKRQLAGQRELGTFAKNEALLQRTAEYRAQVEMRSTMRRIEELTELRKSGRINDDQFIGYSSYAYKNGHLPPEVENVLFPGAKTN